MHSPSVDQNPAFGSSVSFGSIPRLLEAAMAAPSGDNNQPWRFRRSPEGFEVLWDQARASAAMDETRAGSRLALGALLENVRIASTLMGLRASWVLDPRLDHPGVWARVALTPGQQEADPLSKSLFDRQTTRGPFVPEPLSRDEELRLKSTVVESAATHVVSNREELEGLSSILADGDRIRFEIAQSMTDLHRWLRWTAKEAEATRDGLDVRTLGLGGLDRSFLRMTQGPLMAQILRHSGLPQIASRLTLSLTRNSSALACISVLDLAPQSLVEAGQCLERVWLEATDIGLCCQPMATIPLLGMLPFESPLLTARQRTEMTFLTQVVSRAFLLRTNQRPVMLLRVGRGAPCAVRTLRRPVEAVLE